MPWQRYVADVALEVDVKSGRLAYREVVVTVMRQQGKTTLQLPVMVHRCIGFGSPQEVSYAAQSGVAARDKLLDEHWPLIQASPLGDRATLRRQSGHEAIMWGNGSRHTLTASTEKAGHGRVLDLGTVDEAFAYQDARVEQAFLPAMQTRPQPQLWVMSTAGTETSTYLNAKVDSGRRRCESGEPSQVAFFEWSFADDDDPYDPRTWWSRMPAMGHTVDERAVAAAGESMEEREFLRAFGNRRVELRREEAFPPGAWRSCADAASRPDGRVAFSVDMPPDRSAVSIAVSGRRPDGLPHLELMERQRGSAWAVPWIAERTLRWNPCAVVIDGSGPASSLIPDLERAGVPLVVLSTREIGQTCGALNDAVIAGQVRHLDDPRINEAVEAAAKRTLGDGLWAWGRKSSLSDISPLVAVTLAFHGLTVHGSDGGEPNIW